MDDSALADAERGRLDRFATAFERLSASEYAMFAVEEDAGAAEAMRAAQASLREAARVTAIRAAVAAFRAAAERAYDRRLNVPDAFMLYQVLPGRPEDRVRFFASLERAVVGVILWYALPDEHLGALIGPWAGTLDRAGIE